MNDAQQPTVRVEGGYAVVRIPLDQVHGMRVALAECPCRATKSFATADIRKSLERALGRLRLPR